MYISPSEDADRYEAGGSGTLGGIGSDEGLLIPPVPDLPPVQGHPINVDDLPEVIDQMMKNSDFAFSEEYECLETGSEFSREAAKLIENKTKNRYANILPYDYSRVRLSLLPDDQFSDYINATHISGYKTHNDYRYIAAQGPNPHTTIDFWRMLFENDVDTIMMVTNCEEMGKIKCHRYWPVVIAEPMPLLDEMTATLIGVEEFPDYVIRSLEVRMGEEKKTLSQFHYTTWPDHGVPDSTAPLLQMLKKVRDHNDLSRGPMLVHCSAGVGRTGTLIAIDYNSDMAGDCDQVDVFACMNAMRRQRSTTVQTEEQYIFIYRALQDKLSSQDTEMSSIELQHHYDRLQTTDLKTGGTVAESELKRLAKSDEVVMANMRTDSGRHPENKEKNRFQNIVPFEHTRVKLMPQPGVACSDYINASVISGHQRREAYLATQGPMEHVFNDFWRMVWEREVDVIVMLTKLVEQGRAKSDQYWPDRDEAELAMDDFTIRLDSEQKTEYGIERLISVTNQISEQTRTLLHCQFLKWPDAGKKQDGMPMVQMCRRIHNYQVAKAALPITISESIYGNAEIIREEAIHATVKPMVVHCSGGVGRTGAFCALHQSLRRIVEEDRVDVVQTIKHMRSQRMSMVQTSEQYEYIHCVLLDWLKANSKFKSLHGRLPSVYEDADSDPKLKLPAPQPSDIPIVSNPLYSNTGDEPDALPRMPPRKSSSAIQETNIDSFVVREESDLPQLPTKLSSVDDSHAPQLPTKLSSVDDSHAPQLPTKLSSVDDASTSTVQESGPPPYLAVPDVTPHTSVHHVSDVDSSNGTAIVDGAPRVFAVPLETEKTTVAPITSNTPSTTTAADNNSVVINNSVVVQGEFEIPLEKKSLDTLDIDAMFDDNNASSDGITLQNLGGDQVSATDSIALGSNDDRSTFIPLEDVQGFSV